MPSGNRVQACLDSSHTEYVGGVKIRPGDMVAGDVNGVMIALRAHIEEMSEFAQKRVDKEVRMLQQLKPGRLNLDFLHLRQ